MTIALVVRRPSLVLALLIVLIGLRVAPLQAQEVSSQTTVQHVSRTYTREELIAFTIVGVAFAVAWVGVAYLQASERKHEFDARDDERFLEATTKQTKTLIDLAHALGEQRPPSRTNADFLATILESTAKFIKARSDASKP
jgi:hypothetical protein